jgi:hypothetical protein
MNQKEIAEINKYCTPNSILIVTKNKKLIRLFCPFYVKALQDVGFIKKEEIVKVEKVKITQTMELVYIIGGSNYLYKYFIIHYAAEK